MTASPMGVQKASAEGCKLVMLRLHLAVDLFW
jgi:hypothetical protein